MMKLDADIKEYIAAFTGCIICNRHTLGVVLFGSVAKGDFTRFSDIDLAIITDSDLLSYLDYVNKEASRLDPYQDKLIKKRLSLYINPEKKVYNTSLYSE